MGVDLMKAGFILAASAGFLIFSVSSKENVKKVIKLVFKPREKKGPYYLNH